MQYYGATKTYKIRLLNNNQPVKNEIITVKIGKNTVKVKTNNQGYATLKLNLKAGKYTITSTYKNVKVSNKITVKPTLITKNKKNQERKNIMEIKEKIALIEECMDLDAGTINVEDKLTDFEEWDSVTVLSIIAMVDEIFHKTLSGEDLKKARTVADIVAMME